MDFSLNATQLEIQQRARTLAQDVIAPRAAQWDESEEYPWDNVRDLADAGFMGMTIPTQYGGPGHGLLEALLVVEEMAKVCGITGRIVVEANMGAIGILMAYGPEELKRRYAPWVLEGDKPAICISEPEAGSDATAMTTRAELDGSDFVLNGTKAWITGGGVSRLNLVFAKMQHEGREAIGAIAVELGTPGFRVGKRAYMMGLRGIPEMELHFENCRVPATQLVAVGFGRLMAGYNAQRVGAGTVALGVAQGAFEQAVHHAGEREQFGRPIGDFQGLRWMLADSRTRLDAARLLLHRAATQLDEKSGFPDRELAAIAKLFASEAAIQISNDALQVYGARGYSRDYPLERMARDARMFTIGGGTAQTLRNLLGQAIMGSKVNMSKAAQPQPATPPSAG